MNDNPLNRERIRLYDKDRMVVHDTIDTGMQHITRCGRRASWLGKDWSPHLTPSDEPVSCPPCLEALEPDHD